MLPVPRRQLLNLPDIERFRGDAAFLMEIPFLAIGTTERTRELVDPEAVPVIADTMVVKHVMAVQLDDDIASFEIAGTNTTAAVVA